MPRIILIAFFLFSICSCIRKNSDYTETLVLKFRPRVCDRIEAVPSKLTTIGYLGYTGLGNEPIRADDFYVSLVTGDKYLDSAKNFFFEYQNPDFRTNYLMLNYLESNRELASSIPALETALLKDRQTLTRSTSLSNNSGPAGNVVPWQYRVTGVKDLIIRANTKLFQKPAGVSLNEHFTITNFDPRQIINSQTKKLVWGYKDRVPVTSISQWLAFKPMAQPFMNIKLNGQPPEVPAKVQFVISLQTEDDLIITDTLFVNFLAN